MHAKYSFAVITISLLAAHALPAEADSRLRYVDEKSGAEQSVITIKDGKVRMDNAESKSWTLYDASNDSLIAVNPEKGTWTSLDEETMNAVSDQMSAAMAEMRKQMEQMTPEQRAMMEKMTGGMASAGRNMIEMKVDRTGKTLDKAGYSCKQVFLSVGSISRSELCVVDADKLDIPAGDRKTLDAMQARMKKFADSMSESLGANLTMDFESMGGMPVYMKEDKERSGQVLKEIAHSGIAADAFEIPKTYKQEKIEIGE